MRAFGALLRQTLAGALRRQVLVALIAALVFGGLTFSMVLIQLQMSEASSDSTAGNMVLTSGISNAFGTWNVFGLILSVYFGASAVYGEERRRTLPNLLSKPVRRSTVLIGKLTGLAAALFLYQLLGFLIGLALWAALGTESVAPEFYAAGLRSVTVPLAFLSIAALLARWIPALAAGSLAMLFGLIHPFITPMTQSASRIVAGLAKPLFALLPASWPRETVNFAWSSRVTGFETELVVRLAAENLLYAAVLIGLAAWLFEAREVRLR